MAKQQSRSPLNSPKQALSKATHTVAAAEVGHNVTGVTAPVMPKTRKIYKAGEVSISAYFPAEVKAALRMVQAKTGCNLKDCLAEAVHDLFRKYNVPVLVELGEGR